MKISPRLAEFLNKNTQHVMLVIDGYSVKSYTKSLGSVRVIYEKQDNPDEVLHMPYDV